MRRYRQRVFIVCALIAAAAVISGVAVSLFWRGRMKTVYSYARSGYEGAPDMIAASVQVLCASKNIEAGKQISGEDLKLVSFDPDVLPEETLLSFSDAVGKTARIPLSKNCYITEGMLYDDRPYDSEREVEYSCIEINGSISEGSYIDVRICFANGRDHVVLAKKKVVQISERRDSVILYADEEEILRMAGALADRRIQEGVRIYAVAYPQGEIQEPSKPDYVPKVTEDH